MVLSLTMVLPTYQRVSAQPRVDFESVDVLIVVSPDELSCYIQAVKVMENFDCYIIMVIDTLGGFCRNIKCLQRSIVH